MNAEQEVNVKGGIVVGVDGSPGSIAALRWALDEARVTRQQVNVVYGWAHSSDAAVDPVDDVAWREARASIVGKIKEWLLLAEPDTTIDANRITLTPVKASGTAALLQLGEHAQQIVVGRRSLGRVTRWFTGSLSAVLAQSATVPVTIVPERDREDDDIQDDIVLALSSSRSAPDGDQPSTSSRPGRKPVVVGVDGSSTSSHALEFAVRSATIHHAELHVMFCWQLNELGTIPGYERAIAPIDVAQRYAEQRVAEARMKAEIPRGLSVHTHAFHIPAAKGLVSASRYADHLVVGSRGLSGLDARFLGSVSKHVAAAAECTVTVVH